MPENEQITEEVVETESGVEQTSKTFTQSEVDHLIESRLARAKKQMPAKEELDAFKQWKESQKTEAERIAQREQEYHQIVTDRENIKRENIVLRSGVNGEDADYVLYKVSKQDGDFEENLKNFLTENPKFLGQSNTVLNTGVISKNTTSSTADEGWETIIKKKHPNTF